MQMQSEANGNGKQFGKLSQLFLMRAGTMATRAFRTIGLCK